MIYLLWGLLNTGIFLFFIVICFKGTKLIREKTGLFASTIFVFGLLSFMGTSNSDNDTNEPNSNQIKTWKFISADSLSRNTIQLLNIDLEKTLVSKYVLGITCAKDKQVQFNIPISAYSTTTGFISGAKWKPVSIVVNRTTDNNKFEYNVIGVVEWKLLGATIYSQPKRYTGIAITK